MKYVCLFTLQCGGCGSCSERAIVNSLQRRHISLREIADPLGQILNGYAMHCGVCTCIIFGCVYVHHIAAMWSLGSLAVDSISSPISVRSPLLLLNQSTTTPSIGGDLTCTNHYNW